MVVFYYIYSAIIILFVMLQSITFIIIDFWLMFIPVHKRNRFANHMLVVPWTAIVNTIFLMRLKIIGRENVDKNRTTLYICNHQSWIDIQTFCRYSFSASVSKSEVKYIPIIGLLTIYSGALYFDRNKTESRLGIVRDVMKLFKEGHSLCLFPEGTRSMDGNLGEPNMALIKLCYKLKVPVVPAAIEGTRNILPKHRKYLKLFQKVVLKYEKPIHPESFSSDEEFASYCWAMVRNSHNEIKQTYFNQ